MKIPNPYSRGMVVKVTDKLNRTQQYYGLSNEMKSMVGTAFQIKHSIGAGVKLIGPSGKMFTFHHSSVEALPNPEEVLKPIEPQTFDPKKLNL